ncbi:MAG: tRNA lysidine(34) synthetase TilS, partial [Mollicutes bacterium]|nr:tRNA lysidine(34) synthetase TilS [Mollicutes bacterium]
IKEANKLILKEERYIEKHLKNDKILLKYLLNKNDEFIVRTLIYILEKNNLFVEVSFGTARELKKSVDNNKPWIWKINSDYEIRIDYDFLALINKKINYSLPTENEIIKLNKSSNLFDLLKKHDILEIKPAKVGYFYKINENKKTINRIFIDQKMPHFTRNIWPAIFDKNNNIVYMPRYRKKYKINNNSLLIFDVDELYEFVKKEH